MSEFHSAFAEHLAGFVELRHRLGLRFVKQEQMLRAFDQYVRDHDHRGALTEQLARSFAMDVPCTTTTVPSRRYLVVRQFAEYLATFDPFTPRLDPKAICCRRLQPPPYIFTEQEIEQLMRRALDFSMRHPVSNRALQTMIGLAACTGLRPREVRALDCGDLDFEGGILKIRHTKFDKDRLVPVHATTLRALHAYADIRAQMPGAATETAFFLDTRGHRYTKENVCYLFRQIVQKTDLHPPCGKLPTFSALRHTFAVRRLIAWHRAGAQVQALLPALATYMGHVHYTSTSYYLTATAELWGVAAERLDAVSREVPHVEHE